MRSALMASMGALALIMAYSSTALAWDGHRVQELAHQVENYARHVHQEAEYQSHHGSWIERQALLALHDLEEAARHFHRQVERRWSNPRHTEHDFQDLQQAYYRAASAIRWAHFRRHVLRDFRQFEYALSALMNEYYGHHGGGHHDDWDHH